MVPNVLLVLSRSFCLHRLFYLSYVRSLQMFHLQGYRLADKMLHGGKMRDKTRSWCSDWTIMSKYEPRNTIAICIQPISKSHRLAAAIHSTTQCYPSASARLIVSFMSGTNTGRGQWLNTRQYTLMATLNLSIHAHGHIPNDWHAPRDPMTLS